MLKISVVMMTTVLFTGLLIAGPMGVAKTTAGTAEPDVAFVKVKTILIHPAAGLTKMASFRPSTEILDNKPSIRRNSGRMMALH